MTPFPVSVQHIALVWNKILPLLNKVLSRPGNTWKHKNLFDKLIANKCTLWLCADGNKISSITVTQVDGTVFEIELHASDAESWDGHYTALEHLEEVARENGCTKARISGRKGWKRRLTDYQEIRVVDGKYIVLEKRLD